MKKLLLLLLVCGLVMPVVAQDDLTDEEIEQAEYVANAFAKLTGFAGVRVSGTQVVDQELIVTGITVVQTISQDVDGVVVYEDRVPVAVDVTVVQSSAQDIPGQGEVETALTMDLRAVDEALYVRVRDVSTNLLGVYPSGWVNAEDSDAPGFELLNPQGTLDNVLNTQFQVPVDTTTVISINEVIPEVVDDVELRRFDLTIDPQALVESDAIQGALGAFDADALGVDMNDLVSQMAEGMTYAITVWIDPTTDLVSQLAVRMDVDAEISLLGETFDLIQTMEGTSVYSDFDTVFDIDAPDTSDF